MQALFERLKSIYYSIFPPEPLPVLHIGDKVRLFDAKTGQMIFVGTITKLSYPGDPLGRWIQEVGKDVIQHYNFDPPQVVGVIENEYLDEDAKECTFIHPRLQRIELLPEDKPQYREVFSE